MFSTQTPYFQPQPVLSTDPEIPYPGIPACVFHLAAYYNTGRERDLGRGSLFIGVIGWKQNNGHEKYSFQIDGLLNLLRSKQSGSEKYYAFCFFTET